MPAMAAAAGHVPRRPADRARRSRWSVMSRRPCGAGGRSGAARGSVAWSACSLRDVATPARPGGQAVQQDAEGHGHRDGGHGCGRGRVGLAELLDGQQREHHRGESPRAEPGEEPRRRSVEADAEHAQRHRHHPHDGQARQCVQHDGGVQVPECDRQQGGAEEEPHDEREELAAELGQLVGPFEIQRRSVGQRAERDAGDERRDEPVASQRQRHGQRTDCQRQRGQATSTGCQPALARRVAQRQRSGTADHTTDDDTDPELSQRGAQLEPGASRSTWPSWLAATARATMTTGVTIPSLRPLSTLSDRRRRIGMRVSLITCTLSAASVGASDAPRNSASPHGRSNTIAPPATLPRCTAAGPRRAGGPAGPDRAAAPAR